MRHFFLVLLSVVVVFSGLSAQTAPSAAALAAQAKAQGLADPGAPTVPAIEPEAPDAWISTTKYQYKAVNPPLSGIVEAEFDFTALRKVMRAVVCFAGKKTKDMPSNQAIVQFVDTWGYGDESIMAYDAQGYQADKKILYQLGLSYHIRLVIDTGDAQSYDVYVTPSDTKQEIQIAKGYRFRQDAGPMAAIKYVMYRNELGESTAFVTNFKIGPKK